MRRYIFADEGGDFVRRRSPRTSRYFIICTVQMESCEVGGHLLDLRRRLALEGHELGDYFHATEDKQPVRDQVFGLLAGFPFMVQATIMEKSKAQPQVCTSNERFYQYGWLYHARHGLLNAGLVKAEDEVLVTTASIGTRKGQRAFTAGVHDVFQQVLPRDRWKTLFCQSASDPCLQVTDYCTWAIFRKWEKQDLRSYESIKNKISYEYDLWAHGTRHYY